MNKSESIANLAKALAVFQSKIKNPANTANNPFFNSKYAPLNDILNLVRPLLSECGLTVIQSPGGDGEKISVTTLLLHESGEWYESDPVTTKAEKATAQGVGSGITYLRRYSLSATLGISSEDDNDGNPPAGNTLRQGSNQSSNPGNEKILYGPFQGKTITEAWSADPSVVKDIAKNARVVKLKNAATEYIKQMEAKAQGEMAR